MKILHLSDLHLEFGHLPLPETNADVVVLSGDIDTGLDGLIWASQFNVPVIYVFGNHEWYDGLPMKEGLIAAREMAEEMPHVHVLENDSVTIGEVTFHGCTLWTDFELLGNPQLSMSVAKRRMNDYLRIAATSKVMLTPSQTLCLHNSSRAWLKESISQSPTPKNVVVTHHLPSPLLIQEQYRDSELSPAFASDCSELFELPITHWFYGHNHDCNRMDISGITFSTNQRGYHERGEVAQFDVNALVELP